MKEYQRRVMEEHYELNAKISKLDWFLNKPSSMDVLPDVVERERMEMQLASMRVYSYLLKERIAAFQADEDYDG